MIKQLEEEAIPIFEELHPSCKAVFLFDQSSNHNAIPEDALSVASGRIILNDKIVDIEQVTMRPTYFTNKDNERQLQMITRRIRVGDCDKAHKKLKKITRSSYEAQQAVDYAKKQVDTKHKLVKGMKTILKERDLWPEKDKHRPGKDFRADCPKNQKRDDNECCARQLLGSQPDFLAQKSALAEVVEGAGHIIELYPKFHCECNWIERYWGAVKREARLNCEYTTIVQQ